MGLSNRFVFNKKLFNGAQTRLEIKLNFTAYKREKQTRAALLGNQAGRQIPFLNQIERIL